MGESTKIQWCERTASPWHGCSRVHVGCDNCYAEAMSLRNPATLGVWGDDGTRVKSKTFVSKLRKWNKEGEARGEPVSVFPSICDPFEDRPELVEWRNEMFATIDECPWVRLMLLTKRPENVRRMWPDIVQASENWFFDPKEQAARGLTHAGPHASTLTIKNGRRNNVWLLTSVSDQATADAAIPELLKCRDLVPVLGVSYEPALEPVDFRPKAPEAYGILGKFYGTGTFDPTGMSPAPDRVLNCFPKLDWIIVGGESGPEARPFDLAWARSTVRQCKAAGVACFVKQLGANVRSTESGSAADLLFPDGVPKSVQIQGSYERRLSLSFRDPKGGDMSEWPEDLRVREWPAAKERG